MKCILLLLPMLSVVAQPAFRVTSEIIVSTDRMAAEGAVFSPDGKRFAYLSGEHLFVADLATHKTRDAGPWTRAGEKLEFAGDGKSVYFEANNVLYRRTLDGPDDRQGILKYAGRVKASPDGKMLSFLRANQEFLLVALADPDGSNERKLPVIPNKTLALDWLPDSSTIAVLVWNQIGVDHFRTSLWMIPCKSPGPPRQIADWDTTDDGTIWPGEMVWSQDGKGFFLSHGGSIWHYSIPTHAWSKVEDSAGLKEIRRAGRDGLTFAAHRHRFVRTFWESMLEVVGLKGGRDEDDLVLLRIEAK